MATAPSSELLDQALSLARFGRAVRAGAALLLAFLAAAVGLGLLLILAALSAPYALKLAVLVPALLAAAVAMGRAAWLALSMPPPPAVAALVERRFPELQDRFVTAVEIAWSEQPVAMRPWSVVNTSSPALAHAVERRAAEALSGLDLRQAIDTRPLRRLSLGAGLAALALVVSALLFPATWAGILAPAAPQASTPLSGTAGPAHSPAIAGPAVADVTLRLDYPAYTGLPSETRRDDLDSVSALIGTRVTIAARVVGDGPTAELLVGGSARPLVISQANAVSTGFLLQRDVSWSLRATDRAGRTMATPSCLIRALADRPPRVTIVEPGKTLALAEPRPVRLAYEATDDWGLAAVTLEYRAPGDSKWQALPLSSGGGKATSGAFDWDLTPLRLLRGRSVAYRIAARDNDAVSGPKTTATPTYLITVGDQVAQPTTTGAAQEAATDESDGLDQLRQETEELGRQLDEAIDRIDKGRLTDEERARRAAELAEAQRRIAEQADTVSREFAESERRVAEAGSVPPEVQRKIEELHDLLQQAMNEDLRETLKQIQEAVKSLRPEDFQQGLEQARQSQQDFLQRLEQAIDLLKRTRLEQDVARAAQQAEKLAADQQQLNQAREKLEPQATEQARRQAAEERQLQGRESRLENDLRKLAQDAQKADSQTAHKLDQTAQGLKQSRAQQAMQQAADRLQQGDPSGAEQPQEAALSALNQAADSLRQAQSAMAGASRQGLAKAAAEMTRDALYLSRGQEQLMQTTGKLDTLSSRSASRRKAQRETLRRQQEALEKSTRGLADRMRQLSRQTPAMTPELAQRAEETADQMAQAARETAAGAGPEAAATQREAMQGLNELADALAQLSNSPQQGGQGSSLQQLLEQLGALSQDQRGLNQQTEQQSGQGSTPRRQGSRGDLADEQARIREALERLLQKAGKASGLPDKLGGVGDDMRDVEQQLRQERLGRETVQRQQDILHRMLDAQRSVYQRNEERRQRVSERPKPFRLPPSPPELRPRTTPQTGPRMTPGDDAQLPLDFEDIVREYFRALSEGR